MRIYRKVVVAAQGEDGSPRRLLIKARPAHDVLRLVIPTAACNFRALMSSPLDEPTFSHHTHPPHTTLLCNSCPTSLPLAHSGAAPCSVRPFTCHSFRRQAQTVGSRHCFCRGSVLVLVLFFNEIFMFIFPLSTNSNATRLPHPIFSPSLSFHSSLSPVPDPWHNGPETAPRPGRPTHKLKRSRCTSPISLPCATTHAHGCWCSNWRCNKAPGNASLIRL